MDFLEKLNEPLLQFERKIEQLCPSFDMDCVGLNHEACWRGDPGVMPCCGLVVEFEKERGICPFLWVRDN